MADKPVYDFGSGCTNPETFPAKALAEAATRAIEDVGEDFTRYPGDLGHLGLREVLAARESQREGVQVCPEHIALTNGSMQGVTLVAEALMTGDGPDIVVCEELTYSGTIGAYRRLGLRMEGVALDDDGMRPDDLEQVLTRLHKAGTPPRFIYILSTYQNPTGSIMPRARRLQIIDIARRFAVPIVEDNCYADVHFDGAKEPSLYALDPDGTDHIYLCSLSKILGPGVREGYIHARPPMLQRLLDRRFDGGNSLLTAAVLAEFFRDRLWDHCAAMNAALKEKRDAVFSGLQESVGDICTWSRPVGGLFIWVHLPEDVDLDRLLELTAEAGVRCARGRSFHIHSEDVQNIRLAFGQPTVAAIRAGIPVLGECIRAARVAAGGRREATAAG
jgi:2-aminoadipate transaminase